MCPLLGIGFCCREMHHLRLWPGSDAFDCKDATVWLPCLNLGHPWRGIPAAELIIGQDEASLQCLLPCFNRYGSPQQAILCPRVCFQTIQNKKDSYISTNFFLGISEMASISNTWVNKRRNNIQGNGTTSIKSEKHRKICIHHYLVFIHSPPDQRGSQGL